MENSVTSLTNEVLKKSVEVSSSMPEGKGEILQLIEEVRSDIQWEKILIDSNKNRYFIGIDGKGVLGFKIGETALVNKNWYKGCEYIEIRYSKELYLLNDDSLLAFDCKYRFTSKDCVGLEEEEISTNWKRRLSRLQDLQEFEVDIELIRELCKRVKQIANPRYKVIKNGITIERILM